ncbi:radical SAM protein, partial [Paenibacillus massiliensis]|uniref:radical SAM protein n=1 Tax=Paenibacillus massiliensis TaxID=225917 RepID=UPI001E39274D
MAALAARLRAIDGIQRLGVTTNGMLLAAQAYSLREAGVTDMNISLDSLRPATFAAITGADVFDHVWRGLEASLAAGFERVKLNVVYMRGTNDDEVEDFLRLTLKRP